MNRYTQSRPTGGPYLTHALRGTSTSNTHHSTTTHFLYTWYITKTSPALCASVERNFDPFYTRVGCATVCQSGQSIRAVEHSAREIRSCTLRVLRTSLKQTLMHSPCLSGRSAASRVWGTGHCERSIGVVIFYAGTSQLVKLRTTRPPASALGCSCRDAGALRGGAT
jgi:hypothetical protein